MFGLVIVGLMAVIMGYSFLFRPDFVRKLNQSGDRVVGTDHSFIQYRVIVGVGMLCAGAYIFFVGVQHL
jgi:hypothetical protein